MRYLLFTLIIVLNGTLALAHNLPETKTWSTDPVWFDGLVEKATYSSSRVIYGKPRKFEAVFLTNKEDHDLKTLAKSEKSTHTLSVWKHNQVEVVPTPNYDYKFEATSHLTADTLLLTRLDVASQEFCGTSFKQYQLQGDATAPREATWDYFGFSYMPESGRVTAKVEPSPLATVPFNALPLWLRNFDYAAGKEVTFRMLPDQKSNRATSPLPLIAIARPAGESDSAYKIDLIVEGKPLGRFEFAKDRLHVMLRYDAADGSLKYELKTQERVNYWTIKGE